MCPSWFIHPHPFVSAFTCVPHSMFLTNNHKVLHASHQRNISLHGGCMLGAALTLGSNWKYHILGMVIRFLGRGLGYTVFTQKNGTNCNRGGGYHGCQFFCFFLVFFCFPSALLSSQPFLQTERWEMKTDTKAMKWEEIVREMEMNREHGPTGKCQRLGAHSCFNKTSTRNRYNKYKAHRGQRPNRMHKI